MAKKIMIKIETERLFLYPISNEEIKRREQGEWAYTDEGRCNSLGGC
jgi:hypothetical protein